MCRLRSNKHLEFISYIILLLKTIFECFVVVYIGFVSSSSSSLLLLHFTPNQMLVCKQFCIVRIVFNTGYYQNLSSPLRLTCGIVFSSKYYMLWGWVINTKTIMLQRNVSLNFLRVTLHTPRGSESHWAVWNSQRFSSSILTWSQDRFTLNLGAVGADEPKLPRWEFNYNVLRFLTSRVWVMGWN